MRAPWSRGSVSTSQPGVSGSTAGAGLVRGSSAARSTAPSSVLPSTLDPDSAGTVLGDGQETAGVCGPLLALEGGLVAALGTVGVDDLGEVAGGAGQLGGVEPPGLLQQHLLAAGPQGRAGGQGVDRVADDRGLRWLRSCPRCSASRVSGSSATSCWACTTARRPSRRVRPARWVNQSEVEPQCRLLRARSRMSASARSRVSSAATAPFNVWTAARPSTRSSSENPVASRASSTATWARAASSTTAGEAHESTTGSEGRTMRPGSHPPGLGMTSMPARHRMTSSGSTGPEDYCICATRGPRAVSIRTYIRTNVKPLPTRCVQRRRGGTARRSRRAGPPRAPARRRAPGRPSTPSRWVIPSAVQHSDRVRS